MPATSTSFTVVVANESSASGVSSGQFALISACRPESDCGRKGVVEQPESASVVVAIAIHRNFTGHHLCLLTNRRVLDVELEDFVGRHAESLVLRLSDEGRITGLLCFQRRATVFAALHVTARASAAHQQQESQQEPRELRPGEEANHFCSSGCVVMKRRITTPKPTSAQM